MMFNLQKIPARRIRLLTKMLIVFAAIGFTFHAALSASSVALPEEISTQQRDGSVIAYVSSSTDNQEIRTINPDGTADQLLWRVPEGTHRVDGIGLGGLSWHPHSTELAFDSGHDWQRSMNIRDIYSITPDGQTLRRITRPPSPAAYEQFATGTVRFTLDMIEQGDVQLYIEGQDEPFKYFSRLHDTWTFTATLADFGEDARQYIRVWDPESLGNDCNYSEEGWVDVIPNTFTDIGRLDFSIVDDYTCPMLFSPSWTHDGSALNYIFREADQVHPNNNLWQIPSSASIGSLGARLLNMGAYVSRGIPFRVVGGPTAETADDLFFLEYGFNTGIYYAPASNAENHQWFDLGLCSETRCYIHDIEWMPDGSGIVFSRHATGFNATFSIIWHYDFASQQFTEILQLQNEAIGNLSISPDGSTVVFERSSAIFEGTARQQHGPSLQCPCELWLVERDGSNVRLLTEDGRQPAWSRSAPSTPAQPAATPLPTASPTSTPTSAPLPTPLPTTSGQSAPAATPVLARSRFCRQRYGYHTLADDCFFPTRRSIRLSNFSLSNMMQTSDTVPIYDAATTNQPTGNAVTNQIHWIRTGSLHKLDSACELPAVLPLYHFDNASVAARGRSCKIHIGRHSARNLVVLADTRISREHAILRYRDGRLYIRDNRSALGTYLNGKRLRYGDELLIRHNDLIGFGPVLYEYQEQEQVEYRPRQPMLHFKLRASTADGQFDQLLQVVPSSALAEPIAMQAEPLDQNTPNVWRNSLLQPFVKLLSHNTKLQFLGYTLGNIVLAASQSLRTGAFGYGLNLESIATLVLLLGSICAWRYAPTERPYMLFCNGILILLGGTLFLSAGYHVTGATMLLASLETSRGGLKKLQVLNANQIELGKPLSFWAAFWERFGGCAFGQYLVVVRRITSRYDRLGRFLDAHPFLIAPAVQMPARILFTGSMIGAANWVGVFVGFLWISGDLGLALNDAQLKSRVMNALLEVGDSTRLAQAPTYAQSV